MKRQNFVYQMTEEESTKEAFTLSVFFFGLVNIPFGISLFLSPPFPYAIIFIVCMILASIPLYLSTPKYLKMKGYFNKNMKNYRLSYTKNCKKFDTNFVSSNKEELEGICLKLNKICKDKQFSISEELSRNLPKNIDDFLSVMELVNE